MMEESQPHETDPLQAPPRLVDALARLPQKRIAIPARIDQAILRAARTHLRPAGESLPARPTPALWPGILRGVGDFVERHGLRWRPLAPWAALAAAVVLMAWLARPLLDRTSAPLAGQRVEDLNRDGRIDILDAFALARQVEHGEKPGRQLDLNGDGMIDRRDAELIAAHAVSLEKGNHL